MWFILALLSAVFATVRRTGEKKLSHQLNHFTLGWTVQLFSLPILALALLCVGTLFNPLDLGPKFWVPTIAGWIGFYPLNAFLYIGALRSGEMSKILPLQSLGPAFALVLSWLLIQQTPSAIATTAIAVIVLGIYVLNLRGKYLHHPFSMFRADKPNLYTLAAVVLVTFMIILDKIAMTASEPTYYSVVSTIGGTIALWITAKIFKVRERVVLRQQIKPLFVLGTLSGLSYVTILFAYDSGLLAYASAVRTGGGLLIGTAIGVCYFKERLTRPKLVGIALVVLGSTVLALN